MSQHLDLLVTPHITAPAPRDRQFPQNSSFTKNSTPGGCPVIISVESSKYHAPEFHEWVSKYHPPGVREGVIKTCELDVPTDKMKGGDVPSVKVKVEREIIMIHNDLLDHDTTVHKHGMDHCNDLSVLQTFSCPDPAPNIRAPQTGCHMISLPSEPTSGKYTTAQESWIVDSYDIKPEVPLPAERPSCLYWSSSSALQPTHTNELYELKEPVNGFGSTAVYSCTGAACERVGAYSRQCMMEISPTFHHRTHRNVMGDDDNNDYRDVSSDFSGKASCRFANAASLTDPNTSLKVRVITF